MAEYDYNQAAQSFNEELRAIQGNTTFEDRVGKLSSKFLPPELLEMSDKEFNELIKKERTKLSKEGLSGKETPMQRILRNDLENLQIARENFYAAYLNDLIELAAHEIDSKIHQGENITDYLERMQGFGGGFVDEKFKKVDAFMDKSGRPAVVMTDVLEDRARLLRQRKAEDPTDVYTTRANMRVKETEHFLSKKISYDPTKEETSALETISRKQEKKSLFQQIIEFFTRPLSYTPALTPIGDTKTRAMGSASVPPDPHAQSTEEPSEDITTYKPPGPS